MEFLLFIEISYLKEYFGETETTVAFSLHVLHFSETFWLLYLNMKMSAILIVFIRTASEEKPEWILWIVKTERVGKTESRKQ